MRVLRSGHSATLSIAYGWDGQSFFALGETRPRGRAFLGGVEQWHLGGGDTPTVVDCGKVAVVRMTVLPNGELLVGGATREGESRWTRPQVVPPGGSDRELTDCYLWGQIAVSPAGDRLVGVGLADSNLVSYQLPIQSPPNPEWGVRIFPTRTQKDVYLSGFAFEPSDGRLLSVERTSVGRRRWDFVARWRSPDTGAPVGEPVRLPVDQLPHDGGAFRLALGGTRLIGMHASTLRSFNLTKPDEEPAKVMPGRKHFTGVAVHPDGRRVLATSNDETVREYDADTLHELRAYAWKVGRLRCVAIAPDGLTAAAGSDTGRVVIWDLGDS